MQDFENVSAVSMDLNAYKSWDEFLKVFKSSPDHEFIEVDMQGRDKGIKKQSLKGKLVFRANIKVNGKILPRVWRSSLEEAIKDRDKHLSTKVPKVTKNRYTKDLKIIYFGKAADEFVEKTKKDRINTYKSYRDSMTFWNSLNCTLLSELNSEIELIKKLISKCNYQNTAMVRLVALRGLVVYFKKLKYPLDFEIPEFFEILEEEVYKLPPGINEVVYLKKKQFNEFFELGEKLSQGEIFIPRVNLFHKKPEFEYVTRAFEFYKTLASSGIRPGEGSALMTDKVYLNERLIAIERTVVSDNSVQNKAKSDSSSRIIPIPDSIFPLIQDLYLRALERPPVSVHGVDCYPLFVDLLTDYRYTFKSLIKHMGLRNSITLYKLKHTFGTYFCDHYKDVARVEKYLGRILGHSDEERERKHGSVTNRYTTSLEDWQHLLTSFDIFNYAKKKEVSQIEFIESLIAEGFSGSTAVNIAKVIRTDFAKAIDQIKTYRITFTHEQVLLIYGLNTPLTPQFAQDSYSSNSLKIVV